MPLDAATIERIFAGALADDPWREVVEDLVERLDAVIVVLAFRTLRQDLPSVGVQAFRGVGAEVWRRHGAAYASIQTFSFDRMEPGAIETLVEETAADPEGVRRIREELHRPLGVGGCHAVALWDRGQPVGYLVWIKAADSPLTSEQAELVLDYAKPLARAVGGFHRMRVAELSSRLAADALGRLEVGLVAVDSQDRILFSNAVAERLIAVSPELGIHDGRLVAARPDLAARLVQSRGAPQAAQVAGRGEGAIGLVMVPVRQGRDELGPGSRPERAIYLHEMSRSAPVPEQVIAELFGLSRAEARLAALLCMGLTIREAAERMDITENSARTYSKLAFSKLGVSRQAELVRRILSSVAMFGGGGLS